MSRPVRALLAVVAIGLCVGLYFAPHLTVRAMLRAAERGDARTLVSHVDLPALRTDLKSQWASAARTRLGGDGSGGLGDFSTALVTAAAGPAIDGMASEQGLALLFAGRGLARRDPLAHWLPRSAPSAPPSPEAGLPRSSTRMTMGYRDLSTFVVSLEIGGDPALPATLRFERRHLVFWTLTGIDLSQIDPAAFIGID